MLLSFLIFQQNVCTAFSVSVLTCKATPVLITTLTIQCAVYRLYCGPALLSVQQGQREGRQTVGHNSNISSRHTALYIYTAAQTVCFCCTVTVSCTEKRYRVFVCIMCSTMYKSNTDQKHFNISMLY